MLCYLVVVVSQEGVAIVAAAEKSEVDRKKLNVLIINYLLKSKQCSVNQLKPLRLTEGSLIY